MLATIKLPDEVYLATLDLMGAERPPNPRAARERVDRAARGVVTHPELETVEGVRIPITAFGAALAMFVSLSGPFSEDGGEFAGVSGWRDY